MKSAAGRDTREKPKDRKPSVEETGRKHALFYEKKLSLETQKALSSPDLSVDVFLAWWKGTNLTKEFWLETPNEMIRIHLVARKFAFNPENWNTASESLKSRLLDVLGSSRITERIPCHGLQVMQVDEHSPWRGGSGSEPYVLWIGRSRFPKKLCDQDAPPAVAAGVHGLTAGAMGNEEARAHSGARDLRDQRTPELDGSGAEGDDQGTEGSPRPRGQEHQRAIPHDTAGPEGRSREVQHDAAREGHPRRAHEDAAGPSQCPGRHHLPKGWAYKQIPPEYLDWTVEEAARSSNPSEDLVRLANWWRENKNKKTTRAQQRGLPERGEALPVEEHRRMGACDDAEQLSVPQTAAARRDAHDQGEVAEGAQGTRGAHGDVEASGSLPGGGRTDEGAEAAGNNSRRLKRGASAWEEVLRPRWLGPEKKKEVQKKARKIDAAFRSGSTTRCAGKPLTRARKERRSCGGKGPPAWRLEVLSSW